MSENEQNKEQWEEVNEDVAEAEQIELMEELTEEEEMEIQGGASAGKSYSEFLVMLPEEPMNNYLPASSVKWTDFSGISHQSIESSINSVVFSMIHRGGGPGGCSFSARLSGEKIILRIFLDYSAPSYGSINRAPKLMKFNYIAKSGRRRSVTRKIPIYKN